MLALDSGINLDIEQYGQGSETLVLLHGLASNKNIWNLSIPFLIDKSRVLSLDLRGHGLSNKPDLGYSWQDIRNDLAGLFEKLALDNLILVGHSWGADVALNFAAHYPHRVKALCLVDGGLIDFQKYLTWSEAQTLLAPPDNEGVSKEDLLKQFPNWLGPAWREDATPFLLSLFQEQANGTFKPCLGKKQHMEIVRALWDQRPYDLYPKIKCPSKILLAIPPLPHNDYTRQLVAYRLEGLEQAERLIKDLKTIVLPDTVHDIPIQRPERLAQEILMLL